MQWSWALIKERFGQYDTQVGNAIGSWRVDLYPF